METQTRPLDVVNTEDAKAKVSDVVVVGDPDQWKILCKASSKSQRWMKSTKAMQTHGGCVVQVTTQQDDLIAESLTFVPGVKIIKDDKGGHRLVHLSW